MIMRLSPVLGVLHYAAQVTWHAVGTDSVAGLLQSMFRFESKSRLISLQPQLSSVKPFCVMNEVSTSQPAEIEHLLCSILGKLMTTLCAGFAVVSGAVESDISAVICWLWPSTQGLRECVGVCTGLDCQAAEALVM